MRCTQFVGLSEVGRVFLSENVMMIECDPCPHCNKFTKTKKDRWSHDITHGMFDEELGLDAYRLKDGRVAKEVVQAVPWSSGPVIFTVLEVDGKRIGEWDQEEIDNA